MSCADGTCSQAQPEAGRSLRADQLWPEPPRATMNLAEQSLAVAFLLVFGRTAQPTGPCISLLGHVVPVLLNLYVLWASLTSPWPRRWSDRLTLVVQMLMALALVGAIVYIVTIYTILYHYRGLVRL